MVCVLRAYMKKCIFSSVPAQATQEGRWVCFWEVQLSFTSLFNSCCRIAKPHCSFLPPSEPLESGTLGPFSTVPGTCGWGMGVTHPVGDTQVRNEPLDFPASNISFLILPGYQGMVLETGQQWHLPSVCLKWPTWGSCSKCQPLPQEGWLSWGIWGLLKEGMGIDMGTGSLE